MSFYRYYATLGESSSAIVETTRQRALQRQVAIETALLLLIVLAALAIAGRLLILDVTSAAVPGPWLSAVRAFL
jgi:hypothetical protein